jgi:hypothetical protein
MIQAHYFIAIGISAGEIGAFKQIAIPTSQGKVLQRIRPAMLLSDNMLYMIRLKRLPPVAHEAIFAAISCSQSHC